MEDDSETPQFITKFFLLSDYRYYANGSLRAGTLKSYRDEENRKLMGARLDTDDGIYSVSYNFSGSARSVKLGGIRLENVENASVYDNVERIQFNYWVFCAAIGRYSPILHGQLLEESAEGYPGDPRLLGYAVFETRALTYAMRSYLVSRDRLRNFTLDARRVKYDKRTNLIHATGQTFEDDPRTHQNAFDDALFGKRRFFAPESEFRIVFLPPDRACLNDMNGPLNMQSQVLKRAIVEIGPLTYRTSKQV